MTTVGELADSIQYGHTASSTSEQVGPRFLRITDIQENRVDWETVPFCQIPQNQIPKYRLAKGDLVFARTGATVGKSFLIQTEIPESIFASYLIRVRVTKAIEARYLYYFFQSSDYWHQISDSSSGIGQPNVNGTKLAGITLPIAPLPEQRRIVARIEELFSRLDAGVAALRHAKAQLQRYRQSVLAAAVTGQLTQVWRECILRSDAVASRLKMGSKAISGLPISWCEMKLNELVPVDSPILYGILQPGSDLDGGVPYVRPTEMVQDRIELGKLRRTSEAIAKKYRRSILRPDDIIMSMVGTIGKIAVVPDALDGGNITQSAVRIRPKAGVVDPLYLALQLRSPFMRRQYDAKRLGTAVPRPNVRDIRAFVARIPPLAEQQQIVAEVEARTTAIDHLEAELDCQITRSNRLRQSTLASAFLGLL